METRPIGEVLPELRAAYARAHGLKRYSAESLAFAARDHMPERKLSTSTLGKVETGERRPSITVMEAIATVLGVQPTAFIEYRLAVIRELFDERAVGYEPAIAHLREFAAGRWDALWEASRAAAALAPQAPDESLSEPATDGAPTRAARSPRRRA